VECGLHPVREVSGRQWLRSRAVRTACVSPCTAAHCEKAAGIDQYCTTTTTTYVDPCRAADNAMLSRQTLRVSASHGRPNTPAVETRDNCTVLGTVPWPTPPPLTPPPPPRNCRRKFARTHVILCLFGAREMIACRMRKQIGIFGQTLAVPPVSLAYNKLTLFERLAKKFHHVNTRSDT